MQNSGQFSPPNPMEFLQRINLVRLDDSLSWVEQNDAILALIRKRDQQMQAAMAS